MKKLTEADWVALRLLTLLMKTDASNTAIRDVNKAMDYYATKLKGHDRLLNIIGILIKETGDDVVNPASATMRRLEKSFNTDRKSTRLNSSH